MASENGKSDDPFERYERIFETLSGQEAEPGGGSPAAEYACIFPGPHAPLGQAVIAALLKLDDGSRPTIDDLGTSDRTFGFDLFGPRPQNDE